jgi:MoaA/NifB/PqqE/SkfB family radical SAM enzyme
MPTDKVLSLLSELQSLGFSGYITFHQLSEAFLDTRLLDVAREARRRGMRPYVHTNGDVLRTSEQLCRETAEVFEYVVVGLYDYTTADERNVQKAFWQERLRGTQVLFSLVENVYARTHSPGNEKMRAVVRRTHPGAACAHPLVYLLIHYNGDIACCCEDMYGELLELNVFETSIRDAWYSERHVRVVNALKEGKRCSFELCSKCTMGPSHYVVEPMHATKHLDR